MDCTPSPPPRPGCPELENEVLGSGSSKFDSQTSKTDITGNLLAMQILRPHPIVAAGLETGTGVQQLGF